MIFIVLLLIPVDPTTESDAKKLTLSRFRTGRMCLIVLHQIFSSSSASGEAGPFELPASNTKGSCNTDYM